MPDLIKTLLDLTDIMIKWILRMIPPFVAIILSITFKIFGNQDWAYYLLSQIFVITAFFVVYKFSNEFFNSKKLALISVFLLEGVFFYSKKK